MVCALVTSVRQAPSQGEELDVTATTATHSRLAAARAVMHERFETYVGSPRVIKVTPEVHVAIGYDLANVVVVQTDDGVVVIDTAICPQRARDVREAMDEHITGPVRAIVYTHSHIDQTGGAVVWVEPETEIWATEAFVPYFFQQYMVMQPTELRRGIRQFGLQLPDHLRAPAAVGLSPDLETITAIPDVRMPTRTFRDQDSVTVGGVEFQLYESPGETHDHLCVWLPQQRVLLAGGNVLHGFPSLYCVRGNVPRSASDWVASLDRMRSFRAEHLISAHGTPISGREEVARTLRDYRDAIQWVHDETIRGINAGVPVDLLAERIRLPRHLAENPLLAETEGEVAWAVRAIAAGRVGWFDERPEALYPVAVNEAARREIDMMGGADVVLAAAASAREEGNNRWSLHLLAKLRDSGLLDERLLNDELAQSLESLAAEITNPNGHSYLVSVAHELRDAPELDKWPRPSDATVAQIPLETFFELVQLRLKTEEARDVHESMWINIPDEEKLFILTVRYGVAEVVQGEPLPDTPPPVAGISVKGLTWRKLCLGLQTPTAAVLCNGLKIHGNVGTVRKFLGRFEPSDNFEGRSTRPRSQPVPTTASTR